MGTIDKDSEKFAASLPVASVGGEPGDPRQQALETVPEVSGTPIEVTSDPESDDREALKAAGPGNAGEDPEVAATAARLAMNRGPKGGGQFGNRGGAPPGNVNGAKDGAFTLAMRAAREALKRGRLKRRKTHDAEALGVIEEVGLADSPLGLRIAADLAVLGREKAELEIIVAKPGIGRVNRLGQLTPPYSRLLDLVERSFVLHRELVDRLAELVAARPSNAPVPSITFRAVDGNTITPQTTPDRFDPEYNARVGARAPVAAPARDDRPEVDHADLDASAPVSDPLEALPVLDPVTLAALLTPRGRTPNQGWGRRDRAGREPFNMLKDPF